MGLQVICTEGTEGTKWPHVSNVRRPRAAMAHSKLSHAQQTSSSTAVFEGLEGSGDPVEICEIYSLPAAESIEEAMVTLRSAITKLAFHASPSESGTLRFQVPLPPYLKALRWLRTQPQSPVLQPRSYFSPRQAQPRKNGAEEINGGSAEHFFKLDASDVGSVAGVGAAVLFSGSEPFCLKDWNSIKRFLSQKYSIIKAYGGMRFDPKVEPSKEWKPFGSFYFFIPQIEFCEGGDCSLLAVTLTWDASIGWPFNKALQNAFTVMETVSTTMCSDHERPLAQVLGREHTPNERSWNEAANQILDSLRNQRVDYSDSIQNGTFDRSVRDHPALFKVVMARRTELEVNRELDPFSLLGWLQDHNRSAFHFAIQVPDGGAFVGSSPERLFVRDGLRVTCEALAGTRARGSTVIEDMQLGTELLHSTKDHFEFKIVRENIKHRMQAICNHVRPVVSKSLLKQRCLQHLYARINGELHNDGGEFDLLSALHPTPAVCGLPQGSAREAISRSEGFDRGFFAGPVGWFCGDGAEFVVGTRSSLIQTLVSSRFQNGNGETNYKGCVSERPLGVPTRSDPSQTLPRSELEMAKGNCIHFYASVGIVKGSVPSSEWSELDLNTSQFEALLGE
ncbi:unnamed protein product [Calypogeia fissa]